MARDLKHGASGYRRGCHCEICRAGHREANARWRAARKAAQQEASDQTAARAQAVADAVRPFDMSAAPMVIDPTAAPGPLEVALAVELDALVGEPPWKRTLSALAAANARIVDQAHLHGRLDVLSGVQLRFLDILDRLRRSPVSAGDGVPADWTGLLQDG